MNEINKVFDGFNIRIIDEGSDFYFMLKDVCDVLGLAHRVVKQRLENDVCSTYAITDDMGRTQHATFVNENGLYDVILDSRKPEARKFRKWVTSDVLPSIRKTGSYQVPKTRQQLQEELLLVTSEEVGQLQQQVQTLEKKVDDQIRLFPSEIDDLYRAVESKSIILTRQMNHDNHDISEPEFKKEIGLTRRRIWSKLKRRYGVSKYIHIKRKDFEDALNYIQQVKWVDLI